jgi:hypothetical protein
MAMIDLVERSARYVMRKYRDHKRAQAGPPPVRYPFREFLEQTRTHRPQYLWGALVGAQLGKNLGHSRVSMLEFGVAGGNGLVELERVAAIAEQAYGIGIDVYGFDTGTGMPRPTDHRDLPNLWGEGDYRMDEARLRARLTRAQLRIGPVGQTVPEFVKSRPAPVAFVAFDLDMYSSTMDAFGLYAGPAENLLPRVTCYFDDILGFSFADCNGERLAIRDFNAREPKRQISPIYGIRHMVGRDQGWMDMMFMLHAIDHPRYNEFDGTNPHAVRQLPLSGS